MVKVLKKVAKVLLIVFAIATISCVLLIALLVFAASQQCVREGSSSPGSRNFDYHCY